MAFMEEMESLEEFRWMMDGLFYTFPFSMQAKQRNSILVTPSQQRLHKSTVSAGTGPSETLVGTRLDSLAW
jgi:hypothetical protein